MKTFLSLLIVIFTLIGLTDASYITWTEATGQIPSCSPPFACDTVLQSSWSRIGPVPLSVLGMIFYTSFLFLAIGSVLEVKGKILQLIVTMGIAGLVFSMYLIFIMAVVLHAWCLYCLISAINCAIVFIVSQILWWNERRLAAKGL